MPLINFLIKQSSSPSAGPWSALFPFLLAARRFRRSRLHGGLSHWFPIFCGLSVRFCNWNHKNKSKNQPAPYAPAQSSSTLGTPARSEPSPHPPTHTRAASAFGGSTRSRAFAEGRLGIVHGIRGCWRPAMSCLQWRTRCLGLGKPWGNRIPICWGVVLVCGLWIEQEMKEMFGGTCREPRLGCCCPVYLS